MVEIFALLFLPHVMLVRVVISVLYKKSNIYLERVDLSFFSVI